MQEYDAILKILLRTSADSVLRQVIGRVHVTQWLNIEFPEVKNPRVDLLGFTADEQLIHIELQSSNDPDMALRMAEYFLSIYRRFRTVANQIVLYVGEPPMRMADRLKLPDTASPIFTSRYTLLDFRELDGNALLESSSIDDNLLAILGQLKNQAVAVREILSRIANLDAAARPDYVAKFLILSGLRLLEQIVEEEIEKMPILADIMDHRVIGPAIRKGLEQGREQGLEQGEIKGRSEILRQLLRRRFGSVPAWVESRLASFSSSELDDIAVRIFDAASLEDLFER